MIPVRFIAYSFPLPIHGEAFGGSDSEIEKVVLP
jgi:hypothetical protein